MRTTIHHGFPDPRQQFVGHENNIFHTVNQSWDFFCNAVAKGKYFHIKGQNATH